MALTGDRGKIIRRAAAPAKGTQLKIIDVSEKPLKPNVLREGKQVPYVPIDKAVVDRFITPDIIVQPSQIPRVVSQSIPPGTKVARGASVDVVLAPRSKIPGGIFTGGHAGLADRSVADIVDRLLVKPEVAAAVLDFENASDLPQETRRMVQAELAGNNVTIRDDDSTQSFDAAFRTLKGAAAFK